MRSPAFRCAFVLLLLASACDLEDPNSRRCSTTQECGFGYVCRAGVCIDCPECRERMPVAGTVAIEGLREVSSILTAKPVGFHLGKPVGRLTYQWERCDGAGENCQPIQGAVTEDYRVGFPEADRTLRASITVRNICAEGCGEASARSDSSGVINGVAPTAGTASISGTVQAGETLTAEPKGFSLGAPQGVYTYQWRRCAADGSACVDLPGATSRHYVPTLPDINSTLAVRVGAANSCAVGCASVFVDSPLTATPVAGVAPTPGVVTLQDDVPNDQLDAVVGALLTAVPSGYSVGVPAGTYGYQWFRCVSGVCTEVATTPTYRLVEEDINAKIKATITAANDCSLGCTSAAATSASSALVAGIPPTAGTIVVAQDATGNYHAKASGFTEGTPTGLVSSRWLRCDAAGTACGAIPGANSSAPAGATVDASYQDAVYMPTAADINSTLVFEVTVRNECERACATVVQSSAPTALVAGRTPSPGSASISGTARFGQVVTASPSGFSLGIPQGAYRFQWHRCQGVSCTPIPGAQSATYLIGFDDIDSTLKAEIRMVNSCTAGCGVSAPASATTAVVEGISPSSAAASVAIAGALQYGRTLVATPSGFALGTPQAQLSYQWMRCKAGCADIPGATSPTYVTQEADIGFTVGARVTATNTCTGCTAAFKEGVASAVIKAQPPIAGSVQIQRLGTEYNSKLHALLEGFDLGVPVANPTYAWQRCTPDLSTCTAVPETSADYTPVDALDIGSRMRVTVSASNVSASCPASLGCGSVSVVSAASTVLGGVPPQAGTVSLTVSGGLPSYGATVTATPSGFQMGTPTGTMSYQWVRCDASGAACVNISGANAASYLLAMSDIDRRIGVRVTVANSCVGGCGTASVLEVLPSVTSGSAPAVGPIPVSNSAAPKFGDTLTASPAFDLGAPPATYTYQWHRCVSPQTPPCNVISGATAAAYTLTEADIDATVYVHVVASNGTCSGCSTASGDSAVIGPVAGIPPVATAADISGLPRYGDPVSAVTSSFSFGVPTAVLTYQWYRCDSSKTNCQPITLDGTGSDYTPVYDDLDSTLYVTVTASNDHLCVNGCASVSASSPIGDLVQGIAPLVGPITGNPPATPPADWPVVSHLSSPVAPSTLSVVPSDFLQLLNPGVPAADVTYQWQRCTSASTASCTDIIGQTSPTYQFLETDYDQYFRVLVTASNAAKCLSGCGTDAVYSPLNVDPLGDPGPVVAGIKPVAGSVTFAGTLVADQLLTASHSFDLGLPPAASVTYTWYRCTTAAGDGCIQAAMGASNQYRLQTEDVDRFMKVRVDASNVGQCVRGCGTAGQDSAVAASRVRGVTPTIGSISLDGSPVVGAAMPLTQTGYLPGFPPAAAATYQWYRCTDATQASCTIPVGTNSTSYTPVPADVDFRLAVRVTATNSCVLGCGTATDLTAPSAVVKGVPPVAGTITFNARPAYGVPVNVTHSGWVDGIPPATWTYTWQSCLSVAPFTCTTASGPTTVGPPYAAPAYTPVAGDVDKVLRLQVVADNTCVDGCSGDSRHTSPDSLVVAGKLPIAGTTSITLSSSTVGNTLTANPSSFDLGMPGASYTYEWWRCDLAGTACGGGPVGTAASYTLVDADIDSAMKLVVRATNAGMCQFGCGTSAASATALTAQVQGISPTIGTLTFDPPSGANYLVGDTMTVRLSAFDRGHPQANLRYQWFRCATAATPIGSCGLAKDDPINNTSTSTYPLVAADVDQIIRVVATLDNTCAIGCATTAATQAQTATYVFGKPPSASSASVTIDVTTPTAGQTLTATRSGFVSGVPAEDYRYVWQRCDGGGTCTTVAQGVDLTTYTAAAGDIGSGIQVQVYAKNYCTNGCAEVSATSAPTAPVVCATPTVGTVSIAGTPRYGYTLAANPSGFSLGVPAGEYAYQWRHCNPVCADIPGADAATYFVPYAYINQRLEVSVTASNTCGSSAAATAQTAAPVGYLVDTTYNATGARIIDVEGRGEDDFGNAVAVQSDGKIVLAGTFYYDALYGNDVVAVRTSAAGAYDPNQNFRHDGTTGQHVGAVSGFSYQDANTLDDQVNAAVVRATGEVVMCGQAAGAFAIWQLLANGDLDTGFGSGGSVLINPSAGADVCYGVTESGGKIYAVGNAGPSAFAVKLNGDGTYDNTFSGDGRQPLAIAGGAAVGYDVVVDAGGGVHIVGSANDGTDGLAVRLLSNGNLDTAFDADGILIMDFVPDASTAEQLRGVAISSGRMVAAGNAGGQFAMSMYNRTSGASINTFDGDGKLLFGSGGGAFDLVAEAAGTFVVAGTANDGTADRVVASVVSATGVVTGTAWGAFGQQAYGRSVDVDAGGKIVVGGYAWNGTDYDLLITRFNRP